MNLSPEAQASLAELSVAIAQNPETRKQFANLVKKVKPEYGNSFHDVTNEDMREDIKAEFRKRDEELAKREALSRLNEQRNSLRDRYDDSAMGDIEKLMEKHGISDYEIGAKIYAADTKPSMPHPSAGDYSWKMPNIEMKDFNNLPQIRREKAFQAVDEVIRNRKAS